MRPALVSLVGTGQANVIECRIPPLSTAADTVTTACGSSINQSSGLMLGINSPHATREISGGRRGTILARDVVAISTPSFAVLSPVDPASPLRATNSIIATSANDFSVLVLQKVHRARLYREVDPLNAHNPARLYKAALSPFCRLRRELCSPAAPRGPHPAEAEDGWVSMSALGLALEGPTISAQRLSFVHPIYT